MLTFSFYYLCCVVVSLWLLLPLSGDAAHDHKRTCQSYSPQLKFDNSAIPARHTLNFCRLYAQETCCNVTHSSYIMNKAALYYSEDVSPACRNIAVQLLCSPCHPEVGTGVKSGLCESSCHDFYHSCKSDLFTLGFAGSSLEPCHDKAGVCWNLGDAMSGDWKGFCEQMGFKVIGRDAVRATEGSSSSSLNKRARGVELMNEILRHSSENGISSSVPSSLYVGPECFDYNHLGKLKQAGRGTGQGWLALGVRVVLVLGLTVGLGFVGWYLLRAKLHNTRNKATAMRQARVDLFAKNNKQS